MLFFFQRGLRATHVCGHHVVRNVIYVDTYTWQTNIYEGHKPACVGNNTYTLSNIIDDKNTYTIYIVPSCEYSIYPLYSQEIAFRLCYNCKKNKKIKNHPSAAVQISSSESPQHPDLLVSGTNLRNSCLVKMLGDKWASHSLSRRKPPHKKFFFSPLPSWPWTPAEHTLHMTHKAAARDFTAASRMFSHFNRMVSTAVVVKSKVQAPTARSFWLEPQVIETEHCVFAIGHETRIASSYWLAKCHSNKP